jgi:hypothetical protein
MLLIKIGCNKLCHNLLFFKNYAVGIETLTLIVGLEVTHNALSPAANCVPVPRAPMVT